MLPGTEIGAAVASIEALGPDVIGLNCATGPVEMYEAVRYLTRHASLPISIIPNAGLPSVVDGEMHYDLGAADMAEHLATFVTEYGVGIVGGCCGTTPEYIATLIDRLRPLRPAARTIEHLPSVSSTLLPHAAPSGRGRSSSSGSAPTQTVPETIPRSDARRGHRCVRSDR